MNDVTRQVSLSEMLARVRGEIDVAIAAGDRERVAALAELFFAGTRGDA